MIGAIKDAIVSEILNRVRGAIPGKIVEVIDSNTVSVQIGVLPKGNTDLPVIVYQVPFMCPYSEDIGVQWKPKVGHTVLLIVNDRSIDTWISGDGDVVEDLGIVRFSLSDVCAIPGLNTVKASREIDKNVSIEMFSNDTRVSILKDGTVEIGGKDVKSIATEALTTAFATHIHRDSITSAPTTPPLDPLTTLPYTPIDMLTWNTTKTRAE